jgi:hypothetical protein
VLCGDGAESPGRSLAQEEDNQTQNPRGPSIVCPENEF